MFSIHENCSSLIEARTCRVLMPPDFWTVKNFGSVPANLCGSTDIKTSISVRLVVRIHHRSLRGCLRLQHALLVFLLHPIGVLVTLRIEIGEMRGVVGNR